MHAERGWLLPLVILSILLFVSSYGSLWEIHIRNLAFLKLTDYFLSPSASPLDPRIHLASTLFDKLTQKHPENYRAYNVRLNGIKNYLFESSNYLYYSGRLHLERARVAEKRGDWKTAADYYQNAINEGTEQTKVEAYLLLGKLLRSKGRNVEFQQLMSEASSFEPSIPMEFTKCSNITLFGGYVDKRDLELNVPIHVILVWNFDVENPTPELIEMLNESSEEGNWHFFIWQDKIFQLGTIENLIPDGGFERTVLPRGAPLPQLPMALYRKQKPVHTIVRYEDPSLKQNMVLGLSGKGETPVGLGSPLANVPIDIPQNVGYLMTGWYKSSEEAAPKIGLRWWLHGAASWDDNLSEFIVEEPATRWTQFAQLAVPPVQTERVQAWVINIDKFSHLYVDNLSLVQVPIPCSNILSD